MYRLMPVDACIGRVNEVGATAINCQRYAYYACTSQRKLTFRRTRFNVADRREADIVDRGRAREAEVATAGLKPRWAPPPLSSGDGG
jgi:hypothetical protein